MKLIVGLGNPGPRYQSNRHNIGFMAVDAIAHRHNFSSSAEKFHGTLQEGRIGSHKLWLLKPLTFMNRSGISVAEMANFYKISPEEVVVLHDELDLPLAKMRAKQGGGHGGHNGLKSLDAHLGNNYWRVRMGISHPGHKDNVHGHVLSDFSKDEIPAAGAMCDAVADHAGIMVSGDMPGFMNKIALAMAPFLAEK